MFNFAVSLLKTLFSIIFKKRKDVIFTFLLLKKENEIMKRHLNLDGKKITSNYSDRFCLSLIAALSKRAINHLTIVKPETLLEWKRRFIKKRWSFKHKKRGRKPVAAELKNLILELETDNPLWGYRRISGELKKLNIDIHDTTVKKIIQTFRKQGKIQPNGSWKKFLKSNWDSLFGMDFMTIDTLLGKRFYLFIILELKSRKIVRYDLTEYPTREFVKQRIELFSEEQPSKKTLIYDNHQRPHQGINRIPDGEINKAIGNIKKERILGGLHHHYYRSSA